MTFLGQHSSPLAVDGKFSARAETTWEVSDGLFLNPIGDLIGNRCTSNLDRIGEHEPRIKL
jgi:hypothetical protein